MSVSSFNGPRPCPLYKVAPFWSSQKRPAWATEDTEDNEICSESIKLRYSFGKGLALFTASLVAEPKIVALR